MSQVIVVPELMVAATDHRLAGQAVQLLPLAVRMSLHRDRVDQLSANLAVAFRG